MYYAKLLWLFASVTNWFGSRSSVFKFSTLSSLSLNGKPILGLWIHFIHVCKQIVFSCFEDPIMGCILSVCKMFLDYIWKLLYKESKLVLRWNLSYHYAMLKTWWRTCEFIYRNWKERMQILSSTLFLQLCSCPHTRTK